MAPQKQGSYGAEGVMLSPRGWRSPNLTYVDKTCIGSSAPTISQAPPPRQGHHPWQGLIITETIHEVNTIYILGPQGVISDDLMLVVYTLHYMFSSSLPWH